MILFEKVFSLLSYYLAFYFEYVNICLITKEKHKFKLFNMLIILLIAGTNYLLTISGIVILKMIFSFISIFLISRYLVKKDFKESLITSIMYYILILIIEYACSIVLIDILQYNPDKFLVSVGVQKCIIGHIINGANLIICMLPVTNKLYRLFINIIDKLHINNRKLFICISSLFITHIMYMNHVSGKIYIVYVILYVMIFIMFIIFMISILYRNYYLKIFNSFLIDKDKDMQIVLDEYKVFKHNIKNDLLAISSVGNNKVKEMIEEYMNTYNLKSDNNTNIGSMPDGLKGIIFQKLINNNKLSASIIVDNFIDNDPMNILNMKDYRKLVESLGILIDNSLEAINEYDKDYVYIYLNETADKYIIKCINPFNNNLDIDSIMNAGTTTKKNHTGIGLNYIKNKTRFIFNCKIINNKFCSELIIKK